MNYRLADLLVFLSVVTFLIIGEGAKTFGRLLA
jgi:hypothetical protein